MVLEVGDLREVGEETLFVKLLLKIVFVLDTIQTLFPHTRLRAQATTHPRLGTRGECPSILYLATRSLGKSLRSITESGSSSSSFRKGEQAARRDRCHRNGPSLDTTLHYTANI